MVSDWDLSAAFLSASDPDLLLMIEPGNIKISSGAGSADEDAWELIKSTEVIPPSSPNPKKPLTFLSKNNNHQQANHAIGNNGQGSGQQAYYPINFNPRLNTAGLFNTMEKWVMKAKTFVEDFSVVTSRPPLSDVEFRHYLDATGILCRPKELRYACYHGGIEPSLRKVVWKHLLNVYPEGLTGNARMDYIRNKAKDYYELRDIWKNAMQNGQVTDEIFCVSNMVRKDVLRTDRHLKFFAGQDDNQNIGNLFNILTTYALNHPSVGYCQGMSDLASPLLVVMGDEAQAYICFCAVMERIKPNFSSDGLAMSLKFAHLAEAVAYYDPTYWQYLKSIGADDLLFCYRWLLLELKREFAFEDTLRMMEVLWSSLPCKPQDVPLYEVKFLGISSQSVPIPVPSLTSSYSKVCALRRSSTALNALDLRQRRINARKPKQSPNLSLDESSLTSLSSAISSSLQSSHAPRKAFHSMDETYEVLKSRDFNVGSSFEILSIQESTSSPQPQPRLVRNLKEFYAISNKQKSDKSLKRGDSSNSMQSSESSTVSNPALQSHSNSVDSEVFMNFQSSPDEDNDDAADHISRTPKFNTYMYPQSLIRERSPQPPPGPPPPSSSSMHFLEQHQQQLNQDNIRKSDTSNNKEAPSRLATIQGSVNSINADSSNGNPRISPSATLQPQKPTSDLISNASKDDQAKLGTGTEFCHDSENDSGNCCSESYDLDEASLEEPEFHQDKCRPTNKLPPPTEFGGGNPMLMFLCLTLLLQHRDHVMRNQFDYNETAMYFDKLVRKHNVTRVLAHARQMYGSYLKQSLPRV